MPHDFAAGEVVQIINPSGIGTRLSYIGSWDGLFRPFREAGLLDHAG